MGFARTGRIWPYYGDADHPVVLYDYTATRGRARRYFHKALESDQARMGPALISCQEFRHRFLDFNKRIALSESTQPIIRAPNADRRDPRSTAVSEGFSELRLAVRG